MGNVTGVSWSRGICSSLKFLGAVPGRGGIIHIALDVSSSSSEEVLVANIDPSDIEMETEVFDIFDIFDIVNCFCKTNIYCSYFCVIYLQLYDSVLFDIICYFY